MARQLPEVHPDITLAQTLPGWIYSDPEVHARILSTIFRRSWQPISHLDALRVPGTALPVTLLEGSLDEPILITRDHDDRLHVLSNACTHRGNLVAEHGAVCSTLRCRYHGRRFDLDGRFKHMPEFEGCQDFPSERDNLPKVPFADFAGIIWCSLDPVCTLEEAVAPIRQRLSYIDTARLTLEPTRSRDYLVNANWALYCDNYLEGLHIPFVHHSLNDALDYGAYVTDLHRWCNLQIGAASKNNPDPCFQPPAGHPDHGQRIAAYYYWLFPNVMLNFYPWGLSVNIVRPLAPTLTKVSFLTFVSDRAMMDRGPGSELDRVEREDEAVVEATQKGVRSTLYTRGRYSPAREQCVHHFHRLLLECLNA